MIKKLGLALSMLTVASAVQARFSDGLILGGFAGLTAGLVTSAIASRCSRPPVVYVEEPVVVERVVHRPVVVQRPVVVERRVVEKPVVAERVVEKPVIVEKPVVMRKKHKATKVAVKEEITSDEQLSVKERELALKEKQVELDLIKAKKELLAEENRKKELALREKALESKKK